MIDVYDLIVSPRQTVREALERMTQNRKGLLFVCDEDAHMIGVVSDGDIRRALLQEAMMITPIESVMNLDPVYARSVEQGKRLLEDQSLLAVPVVDDAGRITSLIIREQARFSLIENVALDVGGQGAGQDLETVAIIPARGGSKRIPKKNIVPLAGKPLLAYAIESARASKYVGEILVSTDDPEIADVAREYGATVPWLRPARLAEDDTPSLDVVLHAVGWILEQWESASAYGLLLEPTAPLRTAEQIDAAVELLRDSDADAVVSVSEVPHVLNPEELLVIEEGRLAAYAAGRTLDDRRLRGRQRPVYVQNGLVYAFRLRGLLEKESLYGETTLPLVVDWDYFLDIDTLADLRRAERRISEQSRRQYPEGS